LLGFFNVLKASGDSSGSIVNALKHALHEKVGHLGTLDPLATGVLTIAVGKATRFFDYFLEKEKEYVFLAKFGFETDTLDMDGNVTARDERIITKQEIESVLSSLTGEIAQMPPRFSAKKVNGVRSYDAARKGMELELSPKDITIFELICEETEEENLFRFFVRCSSGTYVRAIVRDIAKKLNTVATTAAIIRTKSGKFDMKDSVLLEDILKNPSKNLIKVNDILKFCEYSLRFSEAKDLLDGKEIELNGQEGEILATYKNVEFGVLTSKSGHAKMKIYLYEGELDG